MWSALAFACAVAVAAGCSGGGSSADMPCPLRARSCTPEQARMTLTTLYEKSGATPTQAACLVALTPPFHSFTEAFRNNGSGVDVDKAAHCVGGAGNLRILGAKVIDTIDRIDPKFARSVGI